MSTSTEIDRVIKGFYYICKECMNGWYGFFMASFFSIPYIGVIMFPCEPGVCFTKV